MLKYFEESIEYPSNAVLCVGALPEGIMLEYVSGTYLNGFINYCKPIKAFCLERYIQWDEVLDANHKISVQDPPDSRNWVEKKPTTKDELFNLITEPGRLYHVHLDVDFQDDLVILCKIEDTDSYLVFHYDRDVSDCGIGRFSTGDPQDEVIAEFVKYVEGFGYPDEPNRHREIPLHYFQGWVSG